jgi:hypothetical protein
LKLVHLRYRSMGLGAPEKILKTDRSKGNLHVRLIFDLGKKK